jgi:hypothetical protein
MDIDPPTAARFDELDAAIGRYAAVKATVGTELDWQDSRALDSTLKEARDAVVAASRALHDALPGIDHPCHVDGVARNGRIYAPTHDGGVLVISAIVDDDGTLARLAEEAGHDS